MVYVALFTNSKSGKNKLDLKRYGESRRINRLKRIIGDNGEVHVTGKAKDYMGDLEGKVIDACKHNPDAVAIDGGDGTLSTVMSMVSKHWKGDELPFIAIVKGGTFEVLANRLHIDDSFKYLENIVRTQYADDFTVEGINMMSVKDDSKNEHLCFSAGTGFPVLLLEEQYKKKHLKYLRAGLVILRMLGSAIIDGSYYKRFDKHERMIVSGRGHTSNIMEEEDWLSVMAQSIESISVPKILPQPKLFRKAETGNRFHGIGVSIPLRKLLQYAPAIYEGDSVFYRDDNTSKTRPVLEIDRQLKDMLIQSEEPFRYQFNGELSYNHKPCETRELEITSGRVFSFIKDDF